MVKPIIELIDWNVLNYANTGLDTHCPVKLFLKHILFPWFFNVSIGWRLQLSMHYCMHSILLAINCFSSMCLLRIHGVYPIFGLPLPNSICAKHLSKTICAIFDNRPHHGQFGHYPSYIFFYISYVKDPSYFFFCCNFPKLLYSFYSFQIFFIYYSIIVERHVSKLF